jgi:hypothetical protein
MNRSKSFVENLLDISQRKVCIQTKKIQRLDESLQSVSYELARCKRNLADTRAELNNIPKWVRKFCKWRTTR